MFLNQLNTSNHARLAQIIHTLKSVHGFELPMDHSHHWHSLQEQYRAVQSSIVESSQFNSYHTNPEYTKAVLITEAVRILFEIAPRRRRRGVKESTQESSMTKIKERKAHSSKPDFLDLDGDGDTHEPMKQAARQARNKEVDEAKQDPEADKLRDQYLASKLPTYGKTTVAKGAKFHRPGSGHLGRTSSAQADAPGIKPTSMKKLPFLKEYEETVHSDVAFDKIKKAGAQNMKTTSGAIVFYHKGARHELAHHNSPDGHRYVKLKDLNAKLKAMNTSLMENEDLDRAEVLLAAKDLSDRLQDMAEDAAKMAVDKLMPLVDTMKSEFGQQPADGFNDVVRAQLQTVLDAIITAKDQTDNAILALQAGSTPTAASDISAELPAPAQQPSDTTAPDAQPSDTDFEQAFAAAPATSGAEQEPLGRTMKEAVADSAVDQLKNMAVSGKDARGRPVPPLQKQAAAKAVADLSKANVQEKLTKKMSAGDIIHDFVRSDDPKFQGKSKQERTNMALGAYYGMHPEKKKQDESIQHLQSVVESLRAEFRLLQEQFNQHKASYTQSVMEGVVSDPLSTGHGLQGTAILQKMRTIRDQIYEARADIADIQHQQRQQLMIESATETKLTQLAEQKQTTPHGVVAVTTQGKTVKKFFESTQHRDIWMNYNQHMLASHKLINPSDLDAVAARLARTLGK